MHEPSGRTLRAEIISRNAVLNQIFTACGAAFVAIIGIILTYSWRAGVILMPLLMAVVLFAFRYIEYDILAAAARLRGIEADVNARAGERLLTWETDNGLYKTGYGARFRYVALPLCQVRGRLKPLTLRGITSIGSAMRSFRWKISRDSPPQK